mgnify:FL=1
MNKHVFLSAVFVCISLMFFANNSFSQDIYTPNNDDVVMQYPSQPASYPNGLGALAEFVNKNLPETISNDFNGKTYTVRFIIEKDASVYSTEIINPNPNDNYIPFARALKRMIEKMPSWTAAKDNGVLVRSYIDVPITVSNKKTTK